MNYSKLNKAELISLINNLENKNKDKSRDLFISNISHDVRTLLNAIYGNAQILNSDENLSPDHKKNVKKIMQASTHMIDLINNIISISKNLGDDKIILSEFKLKDLLNNIYNIFESLAEFKKLKFEVFYDLDENLYIKADKNKLFYILLNLLGNAFKYTHKGRIYISCKKTKNDKIIFEISDTGIGIKKNLINDIKNNYVQINEQSEGSGLGLGIVCKNLKLLNSNLEIKSSVKEGSKFFFEIKCLKNSKIFDSTKDDIFELQEIKSIKKPNNFLVLIYLKNPDDVLILKKYFTSKNINFKFLLSFETLIKEIKSQNVHMLFIDAKRIKEQELKILKELNKNKIPIIALTASVMSQDLLKINKLFTTYICQPYSFLDLDQSLIMFSNQEFIYTKKKEKTKDIKDIKINLNKNSIQKIIKEANLGNYKACFTLLSGIKDCNTKEFLLQYLNNYDFDELIKILEKKDEMYYEKI